ncbi:MAG: hypothetical protein GF334_08495 [Candidatus Altiarchaeales archaeon]|nr:hypothetical protein [Candidatus Altiarchaeales archaeon]
MLGTKKIPVEMLEKMKPIFKERVKALIEEAFEVAAFLEDPRMLEETWEEVAISFSDSAREEERSFMPKSKNGRDSSLEMKDESNDGVNLVTGKTLSPHRTPKRKRAKSSYKFQGTHKMSKRGRPISKYKGVSWAGGQRPWRARYADVELGLFVDEEAAATAYREYSESLA